MALRALIYDDSETRKLLYIDAKVACSGRLEGNCTRIYVTGASHEFTFRGLILILREEMAVFRNSSSVLSQKIKCNKMISGNIHVPTS